MKLTPGRSFVFFTMSLLLASTVEFIATRYLPGLYEHHLLLTRIGTPVVWAITFSFSLILMLLGISNSVLPVAVLQWALWCYFIHPFVYSNVIIAVTGLLLVLRLVGIIARPVMISNLTKRQSVMFTLLHVSDAAYNRHFSKK